MAGFSISTVLRRPDSIRPTDPSPTPLEPMPEQTVALNRRARHDYAIEQTLEAGLVLTLSLIHI